MSEIALTIIKVAFLALLWLFILSAVSVIRSDLFGKTVRAPDQPQGTGDTATAAREEPSGSAVSRACFTITQGNQAGLSAELAAWSDHDRPRRGLPADLGRRLRLDPARPGGQLRRTASTSRIWAPPTARYVNGQRITAPTTITLADTVRIGKTIMRLEP